MISQSQESQMQVAHAHQPGCSLRRFLFMQSQVEEGKRLRAREEEAAKKIRAGLQAVFKNKSILRPIISKKVAVE